MNPGSTYQITDIVADLKNWWYRCPFFTRGLLYFCSIMYILRLFSYDLAYALVNIPTYTVGSFQITRLLFSPFVFMTIMQLLIGVFSYLPTSAQNEKARGTLRAMAEFMIISLEVNILFLVICYFLSIISSYFLTLPAYGLWGVFFAHLVQKCLEDPEGTTLFLCFPLPVKTKYYPLILMILFSILSNSVRLDIASGFFIGLLHGKKIGKRFNDFLNTNRISSWESSTIFAWIRTLPHYVPNSHLNGPLMDLRGGDHDDHINEMRSTNHYGGPGIVIGESDKAILNVAKEHGSAYGDITEALDGNDKDNEVDLVVEKEAPPPEKKEEEVQEQQAENNLI